MTRNRGQLAAYLFLVAVAAFLVWRGETTADSDRENAQEARASLAREVEKVRLRERRRDRRIRDSRRDALCKFVDAEHDRERARIIEGERQLYGPFRGLLNLTIEQTEQLHRNNRERYNEVFGTRPNFCPPRSKIPPYPTLENLGGP